MVFLRLFLFDLPRFILIFVMKLRVVKIRSTFIFSLMLLALSVTGQGVYHHPEAWFAPAPGVDKYFYDSLQNDRTDRSTLPGIRYGIHVGTSFTSSGFYGNTFQTWIAPEIQLPVSERFFLRAGVVASHVNVTNMNVMPGIYENQGNSANWMSYTVYAEGTYLLSENLSVSGTVFKKIDQTPEWVKRSGYGQEFESYSLSFHYRVSNSMHIGAHIRMDRGNHPFFYSPYGAQPPVGWGPWR